MKEEQTMFSEFQKMAQADIDKYMGLYKNTMQDARNQLKDLPDNLKEEMQIILDEIEEHSSNRNTKGLIECLDRLKKLR